MSRAGNGKTKAQWWLKLVERIQAYHPQANKAFLSHLYHRVSASSLSYVKLSETDDQHASVNRSVANSQKPINQANNIPLHPPEVATILVDLRMDTASIAAGLLLQGVTNQQISLAEVRKEFGEDVAFLIEGVTKISLLASRAKSEPQAEEFRKMILAMAQDIRVILVRLAICLQQMRVVSQSELVPPPRVSREIFEIYAPITHRLGIYWIKNELEDLAFKLSQPDEYDTLCQQVKSYRKGGKDAVRKMVALLSKLLKKYNISGQVLGREKHIYSIYSKLQRKGDTLDSLYDMVGYRIIVRKKADCYRVLGMIHGEFRPIPGRLKDYIALPKSNGYQSLHSVVFGPFGYRVEIQIRTAKMHRVAESGVAAHWSYKEGLHTKKHSAATGYEWLKRMLEIHQNADDPKQFLENVKFDLFPNEIYLFSPAGDIVTLPVGATPVDFAYGVHSEIGDHCQGAKVNGRIVALKSQLTTGDVVEIITNRNQHPSLDWLRFVVTSQARYRINRWEKQRNRSRSIALGRELLGREILKTGHGLSLNEKLLQQATKQMELSSIDELLYRLGSSMLTPVQILHQLFPDLAHGERTTMGKSRLATSVIKSEETPPPALHLDGLLAEMAVVAARCCSPVPGDVIVGIVTTGKGITLHSRGCPNLDSLKDAPERWINTVDWPEESHRHYIARLRVRAKNHRSTPVQISQVIAGAKSCIIKMQLQERDRDPYLLLLDIEVTGTNTLNQMMLTLRSLPSVVVVERILG